MGDRDTKVIGYFAYRSATQIACDGNACLLAGSRSAMRRYLSISDPKNVDEHTIKKTRFGEIMNGMSSEMVNHAIVKAKSQLRTAPAARNPMARG